MSRKTTKILAPFALAACMGLSTPSNATPAGATVADPINFGAAVHENIQMAVNWGKEKAMTLAEMDLDTVLSMMQMDSMYNGFANLISRTGAALQSIQNLEIAEMLSPDVNICGNVSYSLYTSEIGCAVEDEAYGKVYKSSVNKVMFSFIEDDYDTFIQERTENLVVGCSMLSTVDPDDPDIDQRTALQYSECFQAGKIFGAGVSGGTLTSIESAALDKAIEIMVDPTPDEKRSGRLLPGTPEYNKAVVEESSNSLAKIMAIASLHEIKSWVDGPEKADGTVMASKMATLEAWADDKDANWVARVAGGKIKGAGGGSDTSMYPSEIARSSLEIQRWTAVLQLEQFKQQLRAEGLEAMQLAIMAENSK